LLSNDLFPHFTWRGKYNEDTDLSLRILKNGYPTILFNNILADKLKTLSQKGGNTDSIYAEENGLYKKARSLEKQHPDVTKITTKFGRVHHHVDYSLFKSIALIYKDDYVKQDIINEYGMTLVDKDVNLLYT
jgi:GT2 family glycosyltransferase